MILTPSDLPRALIQPIKDTISPPLITDEKLIWFKNSPKIVPIAPNIVFKVSIYGLSMCTIFFIASNAILKPLGILPSIPPRCLMAKSNTFETLSKN